LRRTNQRYDVIAMGTLDSQTLLSGMSSVRLDNYVYTVESLRSVRDHLRPGGSVVEYHMSASDWIAAKVFQTTAEAFRQIPRAELRNRVLFNLTVAAGAAAAGTTVKDAPPVLFQQIEVPRDDWPYLYLKRRTIAAHYVVALLGVLAVALTMIVGVTRGRGRGTGALFLRPTARDLALFSTGAGFLLLESKSVTEMSLLFGATWTVNLLVFASILTVIGIANACAARPSTRALSTIFVGLFLSIGVAYVIPISPLLALPRWGQWLAAGLIVGGPVYFAALVFALIFRDHSETTRGLAFNLVGAIVGGVLEYAAMVTGVKALYLIASLSYVCALAAVRRMQSAPIAHDAQATDRPPERERLIA
jgi:hypothetical protein